MSFLIVSIGFTLAISSKWAYSYFGLSSFEQIVYHVKVPLEGTNTQFIFGWMKKCLLPGIIFGLVFSWTNAWMSKLILILCCIYGLCQIHFFSYAFDQFKTTDFYEKYFVESEVISPKNKNVCEKRRWWGCQRGSVALFNTAHKGKHLIFTK